LLVEVTYHRNRYSKENKLPSPLERMKFNKVIRCAEESVIQKGRYQIGK